MSAQPLSDQAAIAKEVVENVVDYLDFATPVAVDVREDDEQISVSLTGEEPLGVLIGKGGQTLNALEMIVKEIVFHRTGARGKHIMLDAEGYRARQTERLREVARENARRVLETGEAVALEPMTARDRRTAHMALAEIEGVSSFSVGEEPHRHLVICLPGQEADA
ncbi:MAG TPA: R3H domain-containing nucleic acid-binding protein [Armatimonadota bacterium]|nr:R3H domain-containing nucleic acid-binding protein [Armatimonadota bacterium]